MSEEERAREILRRVAFDDRDLAFVISALAEARAEEREACAKIADAAADEWHRFASLSGMAAEIASSIRAQAAKG